MKYRRSFSEDGRTLGSNLPFFVLRANGAPYAGRANFGNVQTSFLQFNDRNGNRIVEDCFRVLLTIQPFVASRKDDSLFITAKAKNHATHTNERFRNDHVNDKLSNTYGSRVFAARPNMYGSRVFAARPNMYGSRVFAARPNTYDQVNGACPNMYGSRVFAARCCRYQLGRLCAR